MTIIQQSQKGYIDKVISCIENGKPLLIENLPDDIDAVLEPVVGRLTMRRGQNLVVKIGDNEVDYDRNFRLYLQTKLSNPHYKPEINAQARAGRGCSAAGRAATTAVRRGCRRVRGPAARRADRAVHGADDARQFLRHRAGPRGSAARPGGRARATGPARDGPGARQAAWRVHDHARGPGGQPPDAARQFPGRHSRGHRADREPGGDQAHRGAGRGRVPGEGLHQHATSACRPRRQRFRTTESAPARPSLPFVASPICSRSAGA